MYVDALTEEQVAQIKATREIDLAVDQYDPPDLKLIISRETLDALCNSHEELRRQLLITKDLMTI